MLVHIRNLNSGAIILRIDGPRVEIKPKRKYEKQKTTNKSNSGKVVACVVMKYDESVYMKPVPSTHIDVCRNACIDLDDVMKSGWQLENGNIVWR